MQRAKQEQTRKTFDDNAQIAKNSKEREEYNNKHLYKNKLSEEYFNQFNTSSR